MNRFQSTIAQGAEQAERFAAERPWICAFLLTPVLFVLLALLFSPAYETNDDPAMAMIAAGKFFAITPDEHLIFTHPVIGLMLKNLYTHEPSIPWYGLYLLTTQVIAHSVIAGLMLLYCPLRRALPWLMCWMLTLGVYFTTHLQFTTTAFLAGLAGVLLLWEAARRVCVFARSDQSASAAAWPQTPRSTLGLVLAGSVLLIWCEMIRWYMFYLLAVLPLSAIGVWWLLQRPGWRVTLKAAGVAALVIVGGLGCQKWHIAYYHADPEWRNFYEYNELRAQFNDTIKVVYNDETRGSFEQAGWSAIDLQMMQAWCYDDPAVFSQEKLQQIWSSRSWQTERKKIRHALADLGELAKEPQVQLGLLLLVVLKLLVPLDRRHLLFNTAVTATSFGMLLFLAIVQKTPPPRVHMPIMAWTAVAIAWNYLNRSLAASDTSPALSIAQAWQGLFARRQRLAIPAFGWARAVCLASATLLVTAGTYKVVREHRKYQRQCTAAQQELTAAFDSFKPSPSKLYVLWGASIPVQNLNPLCSFAALDDYRILWLGWPQQMPCHQEMKARFGIKKLLTEWPNHPEVVAICPEICTEFYAKYVKTHYAQDVRALRAGTLFGSPSFHFQSATADVVGENPRLVQ